MRALRKTAAAPGLELCEIPEPTPGFGEVKIRVLRAGLCGTDVHLYNWDGGAPGSLTPPQTLGHEFCGEIVAVGPGVVEGKGRDELHVGQRVSVEGHVVCGRCRNCRAGRRHMCIRTIGIGVNRDGGFADYVVVPAGNVWVQPDMIDAELGALFDPLGNAVHSCQQAELTGQDVLITGAGPIGVMCAALAQHAGARHVVVTDIQDDRLALASQAGADRAVNVTKETLPDVMAALDIREGFDVGLEMSGAPGGLNTLIDYCTHGATLALLGLPKGAFPVDWGKVITRMFTIKGVYGREMFDTWYLATYMMETSQRLRDSVRSIITHRFSPEEWEQAFEAAASGTAGKVILDWEH
ncbi:L-threonine 3-dehydrogenase [Schaalia suimastitidis]|uniref:L-threonine 3-dehydrogenase n=1 Tax=Schaalia suimastitidis TaxID=121163 RepID=UPI0004051844|nr:L-threonine 3-dehydrogenase [Schaalia suimastitidis]